MMIFGVDPACAIGLVLAIVFVALLIAWLRANPVTTVTQPDLDGDDDDDLPTGNGEPAIVAESPERATMLELPALNAWSAIHTGQHIYAPPTGNEALTPAEAAKFIALLDAADCDDPPRDKHEPELSHCPYCVIAMCDEWGIPLAEARTIGPARYCPKHQHSILARARQGA